MSGTVPIAQYDFAYLTTRMAELRAMSDKELLAEYNSTSQLVGDPKVELIVEVMAERELEF